MKPAPPAGELRLEAGDIHLTVSFETSFEKLRYIGGNTDCYLRIYSGRGGRVP
jgi:hypothetical protein